MTKLGVLNIGEAKEKAGMWLGPAAVLGSCCGLPGAAGGCMPDMGRPLNGTGVGLNASVDGCRPCLSGAVAGVSAAAAAAAAGAPGVGAVVVVVVVVDGSAAALA